MAQPSCFGAIQAVATRIASLTATGAPLNTATAGYCTTILTKAEIKPQVEKGEEDTIKNAAGNLCQAFEECDRLKSVDISLEVCSLEPDFMKLLTGGRTFVSAAKTQGWEFPLPTDSCNNGVCLEFWQLAWDGNQQAASNIFAGTTLTYVHWVFPRVLFQVSDFTIENKFTIFKLDGKAKVNTKITANGPYDDWETAVANAGGVTGLGGYFLDDIVPATQCGVIPVTSAAS